MIRKPLFIVSVCFLLSLNSCSRSIFVTKDKTDMLTREAVFQYLQQPSIYRDQMSGKGLIKLDPLLCVRNTFSMNDKAYFEESMLSDDLKYPLPEKNYQLVIPDSLVSKFRYTGSEKDYAQDYAMIHQFSPLLPTMEPNIFLVQHYIWGNICIDTFCNRTVYRHYLKFKIENRKITFVEPVSSANSDYDFLGWGTFPKRELEDKK